MAITTKSLIVIDREEIQKFSKCIIRQSMKTHHEFSVMIPISFSDLGQELEKAKQFIGKEIKIETTSISLKTAAPMLFHGIVTQVQMHRSDGMAGAIMINGNSTTIAMEGTPHVTSFTEMTLANIVQEVTSKYSAYDKIKPETKVKNDKSLLYTVQYGESDYAFLSRMAAKRGQWFFYNGAKLFFGQPNGNEIELQYGVNLHSFNVDLKIKPLNFEYVGYDPTATKTDTVSSKSVGYKPKGISQAVFDASFDVFNQKTSLHYGNPIEEGNGSTHLADRMEWQLQSRAADLVTATGESDETGLRIGDTITILEKQFSMTGKSIDQSKEQNFGTYILTEIVHHFDEIGTYHNSFVAIPETSERPPYGNVHDVPVAEFQPAVVENNNDPKGLGRVKVAMHWQKNQGKETPWIRMSNPHAGGDKGIFFLPEKGEEVLIGFENGNAEKPYVVGSLYNSKAKTSFANGGNDKKVIQTRSGVKIVINDAKGDILISDKASNTITIDGAGAISISSSKSITMSSEEINLIGGKSILLEAPAVTIIGSDNVLASSGKATLDLTSQGGKSTMSGMESTVDGTNTATINGNSKTTVSATGQTIVSGAIVKLN